MWTEYGTIIEVNTAIPVRHMIKYANGIYEKRKQSNLVVFVLEIRLIIQCAYLAANLAFEQFQKLLLRPSRSVLFMRIILEGRIRDEFIHQWMDEFSLYFFFQWQKNNEQSFIAFMLLFVIFWFWIFFFVIKLWLEIVDKLFWFKAMNIKTKAWMPPSPPPLPPRINYSMIYFLSYTLFTVTLVTV